MTEQKPAPEEKKAKSEATDLDSLFKNSSIEFFEDFEAVAGVAPADSELGKAWAKKNPKAAQKRITDKQRAKQEEEKIAENRRKQRQKARSK